MKKISTKKCFLTILIVALNLILFVRSTQYEAIFAPVTLCTGPIVILIAFSFVNTKSLLKLYNLFYSILVFILLIVFVCLNKKSIVKYPIYNGIALFLNIWTIGIGIIYIIVELEKKQIKVRPTICFVLWILFCILVIVGNSDKWWPIWFLIIFGIYYSIPFDNKGSAELYESIVNGTLIGLILIQGFAFMFRPFDEIRYKGAFYNANDMGIYYSTAYIMVLVKIYELKKKEVKKRYILLWMFFAATLVSFQLFTSCRTAWISSLIVTLVYVVYTCIIKIKESFKVIIEEILILLLFIVVSFPISYASIRYLPCVHPHPVWYWDEWSEEKVHSWDSIDSDKFTSFNEVTEKFYSQVIRFAWKKISIEDSNSSQSDENNSDKVARRLSYEEIEKNNDEKKIIVIVEPFSNRKIDRLFSERITYYKGYLLNSTWIGRSDKEYELYAHIRVDGEDSYRRLWHAQNIWIQAIWSFGYLAGGIVIALTILCLYNKLKYAKKYDDPYCLLALLVSLEYFLVGTMEIVWLPGQLILVLLFLVQKCEIKTKND